MKYALILALVSLFSFACSQNTTELEERIAVLEKKQYETSKALAELQIAVKEPQPDQPIFSAGEATALVINKITNDIQVGERSQGEFYFRSSGLGNIEQRKGGRRCHGLQGIISNGDPNKSFDEQYLSNGTWAVTTTLNLPESGGSTSTVIPAVDFLFEWLVYENSQQVVVSHSQDEIPIC